MSTQPTPDATNAGPLDIDSLERVNAAATPGPRHVYDRGIAYEVHYGPQNLDDNGYCYREDDDGTRHECWVLDGEQHTPQALADAQHVATFDPDTIAALITAARQWETQVNAVRAMHFPITFQAPYDEGETECDHCEQRWPCDTIAALDTADTQRVGDAWSEVRALQNDFAALRDENADLRHALDELRAASSTTTQETATP